MHGVEHETLQIMYAGKPQEPDPVDQKLSLEHEGVKLGASSPSKAASPAPRAGTPVPRAGTPKAATPKPTSPLVPTKAPTPPPASPKKAGPASPKAANGVDISKTLADPSVPVEEKKKAEESVPPTVLESLADEAQKPGASAEAAKPVAEPAKGPVVGEGTPAAALPAAQPDEEPAKGTASPKTSSAKKRKAEPASPRAGTRRSARLK